MEKQAFDEGLPSPSASSNGSSREQRRERVQNVVRVVLLVLSLSLLHYKYDLFSSSRALFPPTSPFPWTQAKEEPACPWIPPLHPSSPFLPKLQAELAKPEFYNRTAYLHSGAVQIPTFTEDGMGEVGEDPKWEKFGRYHEYLERSWPLVHKTLKKETVNAYGLLYTWQGSDESLKPVLLTGHQDTVPVANETLEEWEYPPFSGSFDGTRIWGRGAVDDKASITSIMVALESLIAHGFTPKRTILLSFGFDEETIGFRGAYKLADHLLSRYGPSSLAFVIDEGTGYMNLLGSMYAVPSTSEKGYLDVRLTVRTAGGHSALPPAHTSIGILSSLIRTIEDNPPPHELTRKNPLFQCLQCLAEHSPKLDPTARGLIKRSRTSEPALRAVERWFAESGLEKDNHLAPNEVLMRTTQAVDVFHAGVKSNQLPQQAMAIINHRINVDSSVFEVENRLIDLLTPEAGRYNLSFTAFGRSIIPGSANSPSLELDDPYGTGRDPSAASPTKGAVWDLLGGTIQAVYSRTDGFPHSTELASAAEEERKLHLAPLPAGGATDAYRYQRLSPHVFRYAHFRPEMMGGGHGVNEWIGVSNLLGAVEFVETLLLNADEADF